MRAVALLGILAACGNSQLDSPDAAIPPDATPGDLQNCLAVGASFCHRQAECRSVGEFGPCMAHWEYWQCRPPEMLTKQQIADCQAYWMGLSCVETWHYRANSATRCSVISP